MAAAQHKLSRRALLAGACAGAVVPLPLHCEERSDAAIQCGVSTVTASGLVDLRSPPARCARNDDKWRNALARYDRAVAGLEAVGHTEDDELYDRALGRHSAALARLLRTAAPDLEAVARKLDLMVRHTVFEMPFGECAFAALQRDVRRFAGPPFPAMMA